MAKRHISSKRGAMTKQQLTRISLIAVVVLAIVFALVSCLVLKVPAFAVVVIAVLEAMLGTSLNRVPVWIHGLVFIGQVVCGIVAGQAVFMVLMALIYGLTISCLYVVYYNE